MARAYHGGGEGGGSGEHGEVVDEPRHGAGVLGWRGEDRGDGRANRGGLRESEAEARYRRGGRHCGGGRGREDAFIIVRREKDKNYEVWRDECVVCVCV